jgi:4-amino-4-deoxy-L-arabinose transferase-like glycosyltransferase
MAVGMAILFWVALAFGTLAKGVPLLFVLVPMVALSLTTGVWPRRLRDWRAFRGNWRWWRELRPALGVPLLIVLVGWWVILAGQATHWKLIQDMVGTHFLNRVGLPAPDMTPGGTQDPMKSYGKPPGFFLVAVWATFWPWSILLVPAGFHTWRRLRGKTAIAIDPGPYRFLVAWIVPMWVLLELARGKLPHYPLPLYVPLAILCADTLVQSWNRLTDVLAAKWFEAARWGTMGIWLGMGAAVIAGASLSPDRDLKWICLPFALALMGTGLASAMTWGRPGWPYVLALCWGGSLMVADLMILAEMPELQVSRIAGREMKALQEKDAGVHLGVAGYEEATLVFYAGENVTRFNDAADLIKRVPFMRSGWARVWSGYGAEGARYVVAVEERVRQELDQQHIRYTELPRSDTPKNLEAFRIAGFNTGNFKPVTVTLITNVVKEAPVPTESAPASGSAPATGSEGR